MKKLLIIQLDEAYFLFETLLMLDKYRDALKDFSLTVLTHPESLAKIPEGTRPLINGITSKIEDVLKQEFDLSVNLSMNEAAWPLQHRIHAQQKLGPEQTEEQLVVQDPWSAFLLTLKARAPFIPFHMQDIYKNILGIKRFPQNQKHKKSIHQVAIGLCNTSFYPAEEQEKLINLIHSHHPNIKIRDVSELDEVSNLSDVLYIGPATFSALKLCEHEATGIFLTSQFQGFNLLPSQEGHLVVSSQGKHLQTDKLISLIDSVIAQRDLPKEFAYALYQVDEENLFGSYLKSLNSSDDTYPVYQSHVVLWNFILNLFDINLEITQTTPGQNELLKRQLEVLTKLNRLYDYAMSSVDIIHAEAKAETADNSKIQGHIKNLQEMDEIVDKISQTNSMLRPILDFYRIRRGQNFGNTLLEQSQHSFLTYSEEHQALKALLELFTVTLRKNEVSI